MIPKKQMTYDEWCEVYGQWRWYHEDGTPRTFLPIPGDYPELFGIVTKQADMAFTGREIHDPDVFTREFLRTVPVAWNNFKVEFEMFTGTLDGTNIDPDIFEAGFIRDTEQTETNDALGNSSGSSTGSSTVINGARTDTGDNKSRSISYDQGVQAYNETTTDDIGTHGNDYASGMVDNVSKTSNTTGAETDTQNTQTSTTNNSRAINDRKYKEHIKETRINYYDNLAFMRERFDRVQRFKPFEEYFFPCFAHAESMTGDW